MLMTCRGPQRFVSETSVFFSLFFPLLHAPVHPAHALARAFQIASAPEQHVFTADRSEPCNPHMKGLSRTPTQRYSLLLRATAVSGVLA